MHFCAGPVINRYLLALFRRNGISFKFMIEFGFDILSSDLYTPQINKTTSRSKLFFFSKLIF